MHQWIARCVHEKYGNILKGFGAPQIQLYKPNDGQRYIRDPFHQKLIMIWLIYPGRLDWTSIGVLKWTNESFFTEACILRRFMIINKAWLYEWDSAHSTPTHSRIVQPSSIFEFRGFNQQWSKLWTYTSRWVLPLLLHVGSYEMPSWSWSFVRLKRISRFIHWCRTLKLGLWVTLWWRQVSGTRNWAF